MSLGLVPARTTITRVYYAVPDHYTIGNEFPDWNSALRFAKEKRDRLVAELTDSLGGWASPTEIASTVDSQVRIELRWTMSFPDGGGLDTDVETFHHVADLALRLEQT